MEDNKNIKHRKSAGQSTEISIMTAIVVLVLLAVLSMFLGNLKNLVSASGFKNMFKTGRTEYVAQNKDYNLIARTQVDVQTTSSQGVKFESPDDVLAWIKTNLENILSKDPADITPQDYGTGAKIIAVTENMAESGYKEELKKALMELFEDEQMFENKNTSAAIQVKNKLNEKLPDKITFNSRSKILTLPDSAGPLAGKSLNIRSISNSSKENKMGIYETIVNDLEFE